MTKQEYFKVFDYLCEKGYILSELVEKEWIWVNRHLLKEEFSQKELLKCFHILKDIEKNKGLGILYLKSKNYHLQHAVKKMLNLS